ncbi:type I polyketide synthase [Romeria aff. gracilis LEGE 07310]|uniref:Type I polyketide synthase n=1 Tax=Vasconcelosia minhoensis LEGE 07310 TaxID=915328 RepID=A0A8J7AWS2_9CYAN|nr:type I polyketide synthase [Romeria gracilis]MBE9077337.1 type I polyketide synthase [Romeria aff. gracilis LEGE 07310]
MSHTEDPKTALSPTKRALLALKDMQAKLEASERDRVEPIAIVGMGCRFPGSNTLDEFWQLLHSGTDAIGQTPDDRWSMVQVYHPEPGTPGKLYARAGGYLDQVDQFDPLFFGISPREAVSMDPQQRLLLEVGWEALEQAGYVPQSLINSQTGLFVGIMNLDYFQLATELSLIDPHTATGNAFSVTAGRLAYTFGFQGPCMAVDTACSSSLVSVHLACQSLRSRECNLAMAAGVNLILTPVGTINECQARMLAPDGHCKTFDAQADGYARGEGCGVVMLKRLSDAEADGDRILAVIRGSAVNQDGRSGGLTVPNGPSQQTVIRRALENGGVKPEEVSYVEAHGTGTALGDPIELRALGAVFGANRPADRPLIVGSVKTNFGHLESAAGVAGLIKLVLSLQHLEIPPHLNFETPNPHIPWEQLPIQIPTQPTPWQPLHDKHIAGLSSFGFSGTNAHLLVEAAPEPKPVACDRESQLLTLSAKSEAALNELVQSYVHHLSAHPEQSLADICYTANTGRTAYDHRLAAVADSAEGLRQQLEAFPQAPSIVCRQIAETGRPKIAFLFTGQGSQSLNMGRQLSETQPVFRETLEQCDRILQPLLGQSILDVIYPPTGHSPLNQTAYTQPALFAIEYALSELWRSWGVKPDIVLGHSIGEYVAACVAGVYSLEDGLKLIVERGRLMQALPAGGQMAAVIASYEQVSKAIAPYGDAVAIAAINGPQNTVISGVGESVQSVLRQLEADGIDVHPLHVSHAFHSPLMTPMLAAFQQQAAAIALRPPKVPIVSSVTGEIVTHEVTQPNYWRRQVRHSVNFAKAMQTLADQGYELFLEVGPHPVLLGMGRQCRTPGSGTWLPSLRRGQPDWTQMLTSLGMLWTQGTPIRWAAVEPTPRSRVSLPTYPFQRSRYWVKSENSRWAAQSPVQSPTELSSPIAASDALYEVQWQIVPTEFEAAENQSTAGHWLIFADQQGVGQALAQRLSEPGTTCELVYAYRSPQTVGQVLNPAEPEIFSTQLRSLLAAQPCQGIVHLWSLDLTEESWADMEAAQRLGSGSVLQLVQAVRQQAATPRLWLATQGAQALSERPVALAQAPLWGLGRVLPLEHPELWGGLIDLDPADNSPMAQADIVLRLMQTAAAEDYLAVRDRQIYTARLAPTQRSAVVPFKPKNDSRYLITGGFGSLGLSLAHWLVEQGATHLTLLGRTALPTRSQWPNLPADSKVAQRVQAVQALEAKGAQVEVLQADVSNWEQMTAAFAQLQGSAQPLKGIFHAAGLVAEQPLAEMSQAELQTIMRPKLLGTWYLHQLSRQLSQKMPLEQFVCFSSIASIWGSFGQGHYAAGNAFLDAIAHHRHALGLPALSINWGPWAEGGMASDEIQALLKRVGIETWQPQTALDLLGMLMSQATAQITAARVDWSRFKSVYEIKGARSLLADLGTPAAELKQSDHGPSDFLAGLTTTPQAQRKAYLIAYLKAEVAQVLGLPPTETLSLRQGFTELGLDSLMAVDLKGRLEAGLGKTLSSTLAFNYPNLETLADYLAQAVLEIEPVESAAAAEVPEPATELEALSEDDLAALLDQELAAVGSP